MDNWDTETRIWIVRRCHALESVVSVQREYRGTFSGNPPSRWTIMRLVNNFAEHGTVNGRPYHRNPSVRTEETIAAVAAAIQNNPRVSTRSLSAQMGVSQLCTKIWTYSHIKFKWPTNWTLQTCRFAWLLPEDASNGGRGWKQVELSFHVWRGPFWFKRQHKQTKLSNMECFQPTDTPWDGIASTSCHSVVCSFITLHCRALLLRRKRSHRYGYWRPLLEHVERVFLSRITPNENFFLLCVVSARWCSSSHSPTCYDRIATKISQ